MTNLKSSSWGLVLAIELQSLIRANVAFMITIHTRLLRYKLDMETIEWQEKLLKKDFGIK